MGKVVIEESSLANIALAIRYKNGEETLYLPSEMAEAILALELGEDHVDRILAPILARTSDCPTTVLFPSDIDIIGDYAFYKHPRIQSVTANGAESIGIYAFHTNPQLQTGNFNSATSIGNYAFYEDTNLRTMNIPSATDIGQYAFYNDVSLQELSCRDLINIGQYAFYNCGGLQTIGLTDFSAVKTIGASAFYNCQQLVLDEVAFRDIESIGSNAFYYATKMKKLSIPAFSLSSNKKVIDNDAFYYCTGLEKVDLELGSSSDTYIATYGNNLFQGCGAPIQKFTVTINGKFSKGTKMFYGAYIDELILPTTGYGNILDSEFLGCVIEHITLPKDVTSIGYRSFMGCHSRGMYGTLEIDWPDNLNSLGQSAFESSGLEEVNIPNATFTSMPYNVFESMRNLKRIIIPASVNTFGNSAMAYNPVLEEVIFMGTPTGTFPTSASSAIFHDDELLTDIYVPWSEGDVDTSKWGASNPNLTIHYNSPVNGENINSISIEGNSVLFNRVGKTLSLSIKYNRFAYEEQKGVTWSVTGSENISIDQNGTLTILAQATSDYSVTVTATSTYDASLSATKIIDIKNVYYSIDFHKGEWIDSDTDINGYTVYMSDRPTYNKTSGGWYGQRPRSVATVTFGGYLKFDLKIRSYANRPEYNFVYVSDMDAEHQEYIASGSTTGMKESWAYPMSFSEKEAIYNAYLNSAIGSTKNANSQTVFTDIPLDLLDGEEHFVNVVFTKGNVTSKGNYDDRGYFYVDEAACRINT